MIAILYQAQPSPIKNGIQKPMKPGGYSDSGADIAFELHSRGVKVCTPVDRPHIENDRDWVFPDTEEGIENAIRKGAKILWLNTVLYKGHPIGKFFDRDMELVGQLPHQVDTYDDKWTTNKLLREHGIFIPKTALITQDQGKDYDQQDLNFPVVVKPIRGRGSQGVALVRDKNELDAKLADLFSSGQYGSSVYIEQFLSGQEITLTVMPPGAYYIEGEKQHFEAPWCLPPVKRFNHKDGIAPYNGVVAVVENSALLDDGERRSKEITDACRQCEKAAELLTIKAPIRIDCRADENGRYFLFDLNMKPNMTGPSRPHRKNQDSLSLLAARGMGWNYFDLLQNMLRQRWKAPKSRQAKKPNTTGSIT
ncbi:ATP-grasp domain-containing protein [Pseudozobellia thermophila]|uniref:ATP-grasp domain-containing protein n=1 Tax=Pseudozobellia thermophila TaxID=192903 RepID=A0A1M6NRP3_9FLAO|nr:ATP-grasp domain-containing protein [Pseudozobellia thermophila]SHJ98407.1 ATP-grasp domain-containing protein [Pseudozobellia thermophila]